MGLFCTSSIIEEDYPQLNRDLVSFYSSALRGIAGDPGGIAGHEPAAESAGRPHRVQKVAERPATLLEN